MKKHLISSSFLFIINISIAFTATRDKASESFFDKLIQEQEREIRELKKMRTDFIKKMNSSNFKKELETMQKDLLEDFSRFSAKMRDDRSLAEIPKVEVTDETKGYAIKAEVPGMDNEDVKVSLQGNDLVISGIRRSEVEQKNAGRISSEFHYGEFSRIIHLDQKVDPKSLKVNFDQGIVHIHVNKT